MGKFRSEYDLLKKRQRDFASAVNEQDDIIYNFIEHCEVPESVKTELAAIWERDNKSSEATVDSKWLKNIAGMKIAYEKDKQKLAEHNQRRAKKFEELRGSASASARVLTIEEGRNLRQVEVHNEERKIVISTSNNTLPTTDDLP